MDNAWAALIGITALGACPGPTVDGEVGSTVLAIDNQTADVLTVAYSAGPIVEPTVLASELAPGETTAFFSSSGCFGCWDRPEDLLATLELSRDNGDVVFTYDPVSNADWTLEQTGEYDATYTLVVAP